MGYVPYDSRIVVGIDIVATVHFTPHLQKHVSCPTELVAAHSVREALDAVFEQNQPLRGYILDDQGCLRKHVVIFVDGKTIVDRNGLSDAVNDSSEIYVMQALSGG